MNLPGGKTYDGERASYARSNDSAGGADWEGEVFLSKTIKMDQSGGPDLSKNDKPIQKVGRWI